MTDAFQRWLDEKLAQLNAEKPHRRPCAACNDSGEGPTPDTVCYQCLGPQP